MKREDTLTWVENKDQLVESGFTHSEADEIVACRKDIVRLKFSYRTDEFFAGDEGPSPAQLRIEKIESAAIFRLIFLRFFRENGCDSRKAMDFLLAELYKRAESKNV